MGWVVNAKPRPLYPRGRTCTYCIRGGVGPTGRLAGCGKFRPPPPPGIPSPNCPARSESLYRLSYPGPHLYFATFQKDRHVRGMTSHTRTYKPLIYAASFVPFISFAAIYVYLQHINIEANKAHKIVRHTFRVHVSYLPTLLLFWGTLGQSTEYYVAASLRSDSYGLTRSPVRRPR
jgi:hypothetical protein